ncbi:MAG: DnaJ domain-containing protein [Candidatus Obscuribacterales bacterium]|jgi:curved DNA-binding protein CbpA
MNDLHTAYSVLGLEPGSSMDIIQRRYKRLIMVWHPDRFQNAEGKSDAEEELKKINNAKDLLAKHFDGGHKDTGVCDCRSNSDEDQFQRAPGSTGPGRKTKSTDDIFREEQAAKQRDSERSQEARQKAEQAAKEDHEQTVKTAFAQESERNTESLRWKISIGSGAAFVLLMFLPVIADFVAPPILAGQNVVYGEHGESEKSKQVAADWQSYQKDKEQVASTLVLSGMSIDTFNWRPPFISSSADADSLSRAAYQQLVVKVEEQKKHHAMDVYQARGDVDRYEKAIARSQSVLVEADAKLAQPNISINEQRFAIADQDSHRKYLQENQESLKLAQQRLAELEGESPGAVPVEPRFGPAPAPLFQQQTLVPVEPRSEPDPISPIFQPPIQSSEDAIRARFRQGINGIKN